MIAAIFKKMTRGRRMRFQENGPNIPDELISAQRRGEVVFFCGAGVSVPAKLPTFQGLALDVMRKFGVSKISNATLGAQFEQIEEVIESHGEKKLPFSLDQTFYLLQQEYGKTAVADEVLAAVRVPKGSSTEGHQAILRLSKSREGNHQVVTTNFDLLFDQTDARLRSYIPPALPSLGNGEPINGVVYLHGKWDGAKRNPQTANNLIVSSADFGRAYLADGWANTFIKDLARQYVIVLVGYSAEDPPVRYLLEGLHMQGHAVKPRIYAFERGTPENVTHNWEYRGVTGIAYENHSDLWQSLRTWAQYSEASQDWHRGVIEMAMRLPAELKPHERGQVAFTIGTVEGAKLFSETIPPPPAEWLCVFDSNIRSRKPVSSGPLPSNITFSSQAHYSLNDEIYPTADSQENAVIGKDYLSVLPTDEQHHPRIRLTDSQTVVPARLKYLAYWFTQVMEQPIALWWAAGKPAITGHLKSMIENRLRRADPSHFKYLDAWWSYFEQEKKEPQNFDTRFYRFKDALTAQGWSARMLRSFEDAIKPVFDVARYSDVPPREDEKPVVVKVRLPQMSGVDIIIPDEYLADVVRIYRMCIERYVALSPDSRHNFIPDFLASAEHQIYPELYGYVHWFKSLYTRLTEIAPERAQAEVNSWSLNDSDFFSPLRIHAWRHTGIFMPSVVLDGVCKLSERFFWNNKSYIAPLVGTIWPLLSAQEKDRFQNFVRKGPTREYALLPEKIHDAEAIFSAPFLIALVDAHCELDSASKSLILRAQAHEHWIEPSGLGARRGPRIIRTTTNTAPGPLLTTPINEIVSAAAAIQESAQFPYSSLEPFEGLVKAQGIRAYRALVVSMRAGEYPIAYWRDQFGYLPDGASQRLYLCMVERAIRMPQSTFNELSSSIISFLEKVLLGIFMVSNSKGTAIWDRVFNRLGGEEIEETQDSERHGTRGDILSSPLGRHIRLLLTLYTTERLQQDRALKNDFLKKLNRILATPGNARRFLINMGVTELLWFNYHFPKWTKENLVIRLRSSDDDNEAAWNGFAFLRFTMPPSLFSLVKEDYMNVFSRFSQWHWGKNLSGALHGHFLHYCNGKGREGKNLTEYEARQILQRTDDNGRVNVLHRLSEGGDWRTFQKKFLRNIWPRELKYKNPRVSSALMKLAFDNEADFPEVVNEILPFMTYLIHTDADLHPYKADIMQLATRHPDEMLSLIDAAIQDETLTASTQAVSLLNAIEAGNPLLRETLAMRRLREFLDHHPY